MGLVDPTDTTRSAISLLRSSRNRPSIVGHRGAAATVAENTLASFEYAIRCGVDAVECDVHQSSDGEIVVIHDATLERTTALTGRVIERTAAELSQAGVPTLVEVIECVRGRAILIVEIKGPSPLEKQVVDLLTATEMVDQSILFSFDSEQVRRAKSESPSLVCVWLISDPWLEKGPSVVMDRITEIRADAVGMAYPRFDEFYARHWRSHGVPVFCWTVPPGTEAMRLSEFGVQFLITDHPKELMSEISSTNSYGNRVT